MADAALLGIDLGTTAVKTGVIGMGGQVLAQTHERYPTTRAAGGGRAEQDPDDWLRLIRSALADLERGGAIAHCAALALCSQTNTHVFVDADGTALAPAILWQDTRAAAEAAELDARLDAEEKTALLGAPMPIDASHALARMLWMARHRPEVWAATRWVMLPKDFALFHLTGSVVTDPLATIGLTGPNLAYAEPLFDLVPDSRPKMPPLAPVTEVIGHLREGPGRGLPVINGTMDAWAGLVGAGGAQDGAAVYLSGTSEILGLCADRVIPTPGAVVFPKAAGLRLHAAPTQSGGDAKLWACEALSLTHEAMADLVARTPRSAATPLFLPQLEGERAPLWAPHHRGAFLGLNRRSGAGDLARAVYEGVAFQALWAMETLEASAGIQAAEIQCGGGGFRAEVWGQIRADIFGRPLHRLAAGEPGVLGAAALAGIGTGAYSDLAAAQAALARTDRSFLPDPARSAAYRELYALYREAVAATSDLNRRLAGLSPEIAAAGAENGRSRR
jgi:xylulokinase